MSFATMRDKTLKLKIRVLVHSSLSSLYITANALATKGNVNPSDSWDRGWVTISMSYEGAANDRKLEANAANGD